MFSILPPGQASGSQEAPGPELQSCDSHPGCLEEFAHGALNKGSDLSSPSDLLNNQGLNRMEDSKATANSNGRWISYSNS